MQPDAVSRRQLPSVSSLLIQTQGAFPDSARVCSGTPLGRACMREGRGARRRRLHSGIAREDAAVTPGWQKMRTSPWKGQMAARETHLNAPQAKNPP